MRKTLQLIALVLAYSVPAQINLSAGLKLCMACNGNASDASGNSNHGSVSGASLTTDMSGVPNHAYVFNGTSDNIDVGNLSVYAPTNELSIILWAKSNVTTSNCLFIIDPDNMYDRCVGCAQYLNGAGTMLVWDYGNIMAGARVLHQNMPVDINNWHQYAYIISESCNLKQIYYDGSLIDNSPYSSNGVLNKNKPLYIGGGTSSGGGGSIRWRGKIDNVIIYNRALNQSEVTVLYNNPEFCTTLERLSVQSDPVSICDQVGLRELENSGRVTLYPSVSAGLFYCSVNADELEVIDCSGRVVLSRNGLAAGEGVNAGSLQDGIYNVRIKTGSETNIRKLIISR
jgi:hypothetical protein